MSFIHTNISSVITSQDPVSPPSSLPHFLRASILFQSKLGAQWLAMGSMKNAKETLGEFAFSIVRCLQRFPETTFIQPHWAASLSSKQKVNFAQRGSWFPIQVLPGIIYLSWCLTPTFLHSGSYSSCCELLQLLSALFSPQWMVQFSREPSLLSAHSRLSSVSPNFPLPSLQLVLSSLGH